MVSREEFDSILSNEPRPDRRVAFLGALLATESGLGDRLVIVGGSAIEIYTDGMYVSGDVDIVGGKTRLAPILSQWGFDFDGRYWTRNDLSLVVELGRDKYAGLWEATTVVGTPHGPVRLAAPEDLIVRRLIYAAGDYGKKSAHALDEAVMLYLRLVDRFDTEYLESEVAQEKVVREYEQMLSRARKVSDSPPARRLRLTKR
ncbi:MAG: hypothetical protein KGJ23_09495 [Euryarchaeota archaeon]|nr:hypothetical protein [Euryarchaeota archaeon]MDE2044820.1 hypothetical protein [Thermoplasmata archaeon]